MATLKGIDISHHNTYRLPSEGLEAVARDGFVIMKSTEGVTWQDPAKKGYLKKIGNIDDKQIGFYHYAHAESNKPEDEAESFLQSIRGFEGKALLALDVEQKSLSIGAEKLNKWCIVWLNYVYSTIGVRPLLYIQRSALKMVPSVGMSNYGLWLPAWQTKKPRNCEPWPFIAIWQYDCKGIDKNIFYGSKDQWKRYCEG